MIRTKTLREPSSPADGTRIYVGRRYPRGVKDGTLWHERIHDLGPSLELHRAMLHEGLPVREYKARYAREMKAPPAKDLVAQLARRSRDGETITILCDHPKALPDKDCHRFLLKRLIEERAGSFG